MEIKVVFGAVKTSGGPNFRGDITFDNLVINLGNGFHAGSGTFTVPTSGTYRFSFSAQSGREKNQWSWVDVKKNGVKVFDIWDANKAENSELNNMAYTWLMNLTQSDIVTLYSSYDLYVDADTPVTFTGELIHI